MVPFVMNSVTGRVVYLNEQSTSAADEINFVLVKTKLRTAE